jgi:molybdopterin converting factor small subunit
MARLRLFANLRESAGTSRADFSGDTVGDVIDAAVDEYGSTFAAGLEAAKLWVNGDPAERSTPVADRDEIALIPPVSGGAMTVSRQIDFVGLFLPFALAAVVIAGNYLDAEVFALGLVGVGLVWMWDIGEVLAGQRRPVNLIPAMVSLAVTVSGVYAWGRVGLVGGLIIGLIVTLAWSTLDARQRSIDAVAISLSIAAAGSLGAGLLMIVRLNSQVEVMGFVVVAALAIGTSTVMSGTGQQVAGLDPNLAMLIGAVVGGLVAPSFADTASWRVFGLAAAVAGGAMIAGRAFGSMIRTGHVAHTMRAPGSLTPIDAAALGTIGWWIGLLLFGG